LYFSPSIIRIINVIIIRIRKSKRFIWAGHVTRMEEKRNACRLLEGKPEGERPLAKSRRRRLDNIENGSFRNRIGWCELDWSGSG
jgi:hypothetical protein